MSMEPVNSDVAAEPGGDSGCERNRSDAATLGQLMLAVEELWPESLAEEWDEVGLVAGHPSAEITRVMFAVDPTLEVIDEAIEWGAELLDHPPPLLLKGVTPSRRLRPKAGQSTA